MESLLTGSRVYGTPTIDSDIDMVVLYDNIQDLYLLAGMQSSKVIMCNQGAHLGKEGYPNGISLRFDKLNIIAVTDKKVFEAWRKGTEFLKQIKPVTKEQACLIFETMFGILTEQKTGTFPF